MSSELDSLLRRLELTEKRQAAILDETRKQIAGIRAAIAVTPKAK